MLNFMWVALGVATISALAWWREGRKRQQQAEALSRQIEQLRAENQRLAQSVSTISHDLVQPLGTISNYAEMIRRNATGSMREHAESILDVSARAAHRIRESGTNPRPNGDPIERMAEKTSEPLEDTEPDYAPA